jgi:hypothetical protein
MTTTLQAIADRYHVRLDPPCPVALPAGRADLPALCRDLAMTRGAEIGVWKGEYSLAFCRAIPALTWTCVDPWAPYAAYRDNKNQQALIDQAHAEATEKLSPYRVTFLRMASVAAAPLVPDRSLDVVYLDGNHEAAYIREDLDLWIPKVRPGGLIAGHDYRVNSGKPFIQVKAAVDQYVLDHGIAHWFIFAGDRTPSFLWVVS